jgi:hypothetical protein
MGVFVAMLTALMFLGGALAASDRVGTGDIGWEATNQSEEEPETETFNATTVNPTTVHFGATGTEAAPVQSALEDVDGDGNIDMILHFKTQDTGIQCGEDLRFSHWPDL